MGRERRNPRGVFERKPGEFWIRFADTAGRIRREKAGSKGDAIKLYQQRKTDVLRGRKLPETMRKRVVTFSEICDDLVVYYRAHSKLPKVDECRVERLREQFGRHPVDIPISELRDWLDSQEWAAATFNRYRSTLSIMYQQAIQNGKATTNLGRLIKLKKESNGIVRFLNQYLPAKTAIEYLKAFTTEEERLRAVIQHCYAEHMPEFEIALHTGMRPSEQYNLKWREVDLIRKFVTVPNSKNGETRYIPLNSVVLAVFQDLFHRSDGSGWVFIAKMATGYKATSTGSKMRFVMLGYRSSHGIVSDTLSRADW